MRTDSINLTARLLDWWAEKHGVLFMVAAGNVAEDLTIPGTNVIDLEDATPAERRSLVIDAQRAARHTRTLMAPAEAMNVVTVGGSSEDQAPPLMPPPAGIITLESNGQMLPALSSAIGLGAFRSIKPDFIAPAGEHELRVTSAGAGGVRLRVLGQSQRTGLHVATVARGASTTYRTRGTSCANALATRAALHSHAAITAEDDGPYAGLPITPRDRALLAKALCVNAASWPEAAIDQYTRECAPDPRQHVRAREEISRYYGHGRLNDTKMREAPPLGATLIDLGTLRKDGAAIFRVPLPPSLSGERLGRSLIATIAWFSPVRVTRARYRLAALEAIPHGYDLAGGMTVDDG